MMILLALLTVGLLSLSTIALRSGSHEAARAEAQANARLALTIAIGELQLGVGPDQRITASSSMLDTVPDSETTDGVIHPNLTGIWESRNDALGDKPDYDRAKPFRRWLVSESKNDRVRSLDFATTSDFTEPVLVVGATPGEGDSPGSPAVHAGLVRSGKGGYAWWVADENCKARVGLRDELDLDDSATVAALLASSATPGAHGLRGIAELEDFPTNSKVSDKLISHASLGLVEEEEVRPLRWFHDLSPYSESVIADVTKGGLRKDLSLYLERNDIDWLEGWGWPEGKTRAPRGPLGPNGEIALSHPQDYDVLAWKSLHHWYHMHRRQIGSDAGHPLMAMRNYTSAPDPISNPTWNSNVMRIQPVLVRMQMIVSYGVRKTGTAARGSYNYDIYMYSYPVLILWNPYSVALRVEQWSVFLHTMPLEHSLYKGSQKIQLTGGGTRNGNYNWGWPAGNMVMRFGDAGTPGITFAPGEAKILTYTKSQEGGFHAHDMVEGLEAWTPPSSRDPDGHVGQPRKLATVTAQPSEQIRIETTGSSWNSSSNSYQQFQTTFGFRCENKAVHRGHPDRFRQQMFCSQVCWRRETDKGNPVADFISQTNFPGASFQELDNAPTPFIHLDVRLKTLDEARLPNKTWLHNIPQHPYAAATSTSKHREVDAATSFFAHAYDVNFAQINGIEGVIQNEPFFGPSNRPGGRPVIVAQDIPLAPLTSLAQLQNLPQTPIEGLNWSGYHYQNHAIGNSYASPGLRADEIKARHFPFYLGQYFPWQSGDISGRFYSGLTWFNNADYTVDIAPAAVIDRSYAANHLLFDDYFFSSMAAQEGMIYSRYGRERALPSVVSDFFNGESPLPNACYRAHNGGVEPDKLVARLAGSRRGVPADAHQRAAAHLITTGGFNVNSTSVPAWTAMLASSHLKRPVILGNRGRLLADDRASFVVSRFSAPLMRGGADNSAGSEDSRWIGYRELTADELVELAEAIVEQVKTRGPFRSLGEFVNRRLSTDPDLARYGAIQAALEDSDVSINERYRGVENEITPGDLSGGKYKANYRFEEAALGSRYQGTPAYISQADILMPIAPILNARSDTFLIRGYGESRSADGNKVLARAWCEAVVQRIPEYLDPSDEAHLPPAELTSKTNKIFGRQFIIQSFRWLAPSEIEETST